MNDICTCQICRRTIRRQIEWTFLGRPRWMGERAIRFHGHLGWVPLDLFRDILGPLVLRGIVLKSTPDRGDRKGFPRYLLARCAMPAQVTRRWREFVEGGGA